ncbi:MAG: alpha/beta fold hydrolase [Planctomycetes bacterium]|nr:alpha/beta fold hydrolase [Planctomycetota bacterium]
MSRLSFVAGSVIVAMLFAVAGPLGAQDKKDKKVVVEPVNIITADGVKLKGHFYPSAVKNAPTVIMLHGIGEKKNSKSEDWKKLAEQLQAAEAGYAVMMFDFRGHGDSTTIDDPKTFWSKQINANVKTKAKEDIDVKDYIKQSKVYLPVLVNDIAAVRAWLDRRNDDTKDCNTSRLIVLGADTGATLGALWINSEWYRYKYTPNPMAPALFSRGTFASKPEGADIIGAVFLTIAPSLEGRGKTESMLRMACKENGMGAAFFYGSQDAKAANLAKSLDKNLKDKNSKKHVFIGAVEFNTELSGMKLLQPDLKAGVSVLQYLNGLVEDRTNERVTRDFMDSGFVWRMSPAPQGPFHKARNDKSSKTLNFDDYYKFIPQ